MLRARRTRRGFAGLGVPAETGLPPARVLYLAEETSIAGELLPLNSPALRAAAVAGAEYGWALKGSALARRALDNALRRCNADCRQAAEVAVCAGAWAPLARWGVGSPIVRAAGALAAQGLEAPHERFLEAWIESNTTPLALQVSQEAAALLRGLPAPAWGHYLRAVGALSAAGAPRGRRLFRGVTGAQADAVRRGARLLPTYALSSWTDVADVPGRYAQGGVRVSTWAAPGALLLIPEVFGDRAGDREHILLGAAHPVMDWVELPRE